MAKIAGIEFERENDVRDIKNDEHQEKRRCDSFSRGKPREVPLAIILMRYRKETASDFDDTAILKVDGLVAREHRLDAGINQEGAENDHCPFESLDQREPGENEDAAQDKCAQDAPKKDTHLELGRNLEVAENDNKHKDVVHAQGIFDKVTGKKFDGFFVPKLRVDPTVEAKRKCNVAGRRPKSFANRNLPCLAMKYSEVRCQDGEDEKSESNPG